MGYFSSDGGSKGIRTLTVLGLSKPPPASWAMLPGGNGGIRTPNPAGLSRPALPLAYVSEMAETAGFEPAREPCGPYSRFSKPLPCLVRLTSPYGGGRGSRNPTGTLRPVLAVFKTAPLPLGLFLRNGGAGGSRNPTGTFRPLLGGFRPPALPLGLPLLKWRKRGISKPHWNLAARTGGFRGRSLAFRVTLPLMVDMAGFEPAENAP